ncbi:MAG: alpha/beta hydrolase [Actinomycetota bacterium]
MGSGREGTIRTEVTRGAITGVAAGVPYVALRPAADGKEAPLVVAWHQVDPPRTEAAMAAALPMTGVPAWRLYFGLPMLGARTPAGGFEEVMAHMQEDIALKLLGPIIERAAAEARAAIDVVRAELGIDDGPIGVVGGSAGSAVALLLLAEGALSVTAAALVSPVVQLAPVVELYAPAYGWRAESQALARRLDFVARASDIAGRDPQPAVLQVSGARDHAAFREPARALHDALAGLYADPDRLAVRTVPGMRHALAEAPGIEPAPQTEDAKRVDAEVSEWFRRHLDHLRPPAEAGPGTTDRSGAPPDVEPS